MTLALDLAAIRAAAKADLYSCAESLVGFDGLYPPLHRRVAKFLQDWDKPNKILLIPRRHLKSSFGAIALPVHIWLNEPNARILFIQHKFEMAKGYLGELKRKLENDQIFNIVAPDIFWANPRRESPTWLMHAITVKRSWDNKVPSLSAIGSESNNTGWHYDYIIFDDVVGRENYHTAELRQQVWDLIVQSGPLLAPGGRRLFLGTRWHFEDAYSRILDESGPFAGQVDKLILKVYDEEGKIRFPYDAKRRTGFTQVELDALRKADAAFFSSQYLNEPIAGELRIFDRRHVKRFTLDGDEPFLIPDKNYKVFMAVDLNNKVTEDADYGVAMVGAVDEDRNLWILDMRRGHPKSREMMNWIDTLALKWNPSLIFVEAVAAQYQFFTTLRDFLQERGRWWRVHPVERGGRNSMSKDDRISSLSFFVSGGNLHVRDGFEDLLEELERFAPGTECRRDQLDCLADLHVLGNPPAKRSKDIPRSYALDQLDAEVEARVGRMAFDAHRGTVSSGVPGIQWNLPRN